MGEMAYKTRVYYDDTDAGGVVYYANYLKYCERAKQEFFLSKGCDLFKLHNEGIYLVVSEVKAKYKKSLKLGDEVEVSVALKNIKRASVELLFGIRNGDGDLAAEVEILSVSVDKDLKIVKLPECISNLT